MNLNFLLNLRTFGKFAKSVKTWFDFSLKNKGAKNSCNFTEFREKYF